MLRTLTLRASALAIPALSLVAFPACSFETSNPNERYNIEGDWAFDVPASQAALLPEGAPSHMRVTFGECLPDDCPTTALAGELRFSAPGDTLPTPLSGAVLTYTDSEPSYSEDGEGDALRFNATYITAEADTVTRVFAGKVTSGLVEGQQKWMLQMEVTLEEGAAPFPVTFIQQ